MSQQIKDNEVLKNNNLDDDILEVIKSFIEYFDEIDEGEESGYSCKCR